MKPLYILAVLAAPFFASADDFPAIYNSEETTDADPMTAEEAAASFTLPDGFEISVFASEPDVQNPIAMAWDRRGRMWVAENYTYNGKETRFDLSLRDRIIILEDSDWDGKAEKRTVFTDNVQMLTSVEVGHGGVWLMCPPQLLFIPDADGDDIPDGAAEVKLDGFTVAGSSYHNFANGLRWGPDGWLYGRVGHSCPGNVGKPGTPEDERIPIEGGIWRYHPKRDVFEMITHGTTNPWGHDWDQYGQGFHINTVNGHLWHIIPGAHFKESFGQDPNPYIYERLGQHADHWHFDTTGKWSESRDGAANAFGGGHAHVGMMIYQAEQWPEHMRNKLYTINLHGRRLNVERLDREGSGYVGKHDPDVFLAGDPWFRGIDIQQGPDGSAFIIDWSDTGECHDRTGVHRKSGRVYRLSYGTPEKPDLSDLANLTPEGVERLIRHENVWYPRQLQMALHPQHPPTAVTAPIGTIAGNKKEKTRDRLRAITLMRELGLGLNFDFDTADEHILAEYISSAFDDRSIDTATGAQVNADNRNIEAFLPKFIELANSAQASTRLTLASAIQRIPVKSRSSLATAIASHPEDADDHNLPSMVWFGLTPLVESHPNDLVKVAEATEWPDLLRWISRALTSRIEHSPESLDALTQLIPDSASAKQDALLAGIDEGLKGWRKAEKPANWDKVVAAIDKRANADAIALVQGISTVFGDGRALDAVKKVALDNDADLSLRQTALQTLIDARTPDLRKICESLLGVRMLNTVAVKGLATFDDPKIGASLAKNYRRFYPAERSSVMDVLTSRAAWSSALLDQIAAGKIQKSSLTPYHARQIAAFNDEALTAKLTEVWGQIRATNEARQQQIADWKTKLDTPTLAKADLSKGRQAFTAVCGSCHQLYGEGGKFGPDLTGSGRADISYLLENIVDPSGAVGADYQMNVITMKDGRVLSGVIGSKSADTTVLRQLNEETTLANADIAKTEPFPMSIMPEGLLNALSAEQARDLIAYLMHPSQVPMPK